MLKFKICTKSNIVLWGIILINCLLLIQLELLRVTRSCSYSAWKSQLILPYFPHTKIVVGVGKRVRRERERSYVRIQPVNKIKLFFMCMWNRKQLYNKKKKRKRNVHRLFIYKVSIPEIVQYFESLFRTMKCVLSMEVISGVINVMSVTADNPIKKKTHMTKISEKKGKGSLSPF